MGGGGGGGMDICLTRLGWNIGDLRLALYKLFFFFSRKFTDG